MFPQDIKNCDAKGRYCIEDNSTKTFDCKTTCVGIYADVQWIGHQNIEQEFEEEKADKITTAEGEIDDILLKRVLHLEREMNIMRLDFEEKMKLFAGHRGNEMEKEYMMLISKYRMFKTKNVKNFRFNSAANLNTFGKSLLLANWPKISII